MGSTNSKAGALSRIEGKHWNVRPLEWTIMHILFSPCPLPLSHAVPLGHHKMSFSVLPYLLYHDRLKLRAKIFTASGFSSGGL